MWAKELQKKRMETRPAVYWVLAAVLAVQAVVLVYFAYLRQGYNVDELFTFFLSNNSATTVPYPKTAPDYLSQWHDADYFRDFLTCQPSEAFRFGFVYFNQYADVLGPLYFMLLHLASSFVPGVFSKWIVVTFHIPLFLLCGILLWQMGRRVLKNNWAALFPVILWGFSAGVVSAVLYFRVYQLLMFFVVLITYLAFCIAEARRIRWRMVVAVALTTAGGFLTHYYFVLYTLFLGLALGIYLLLERRFRLLGRSLIGVGAGVALGIGIFPASLHQAFTSYRAREAWSKVAGDGSQWQDTLLVYARAMRDGLFSDTRVLVIVAAVLAVGGLFLLVRWRRHRQGPVQPETTCRVAQLLVAVAGAAGYACSVALVAPYSASRYVYPIFPIVLFLVGALLWLLVRAFLRSRRARVGALAVLAALSVGVGSLGLGRSCVENLRPVGLEDTDQTTVNPEDAAAQNEGASSIALFQDAYVEYLYYLYPEFLHYKKICLLPESQMQQLSALAADVSAEESVLVYVQSAGRNVQAELQFVSAALGRPHAQRMFDSRVFTAYRFTK